MVNNSEIRFYVDTMIVETILSSDGFTKKADIVSGLTESVKNYVSNHINPDDKAGSLLDILAPGAISVTFSAMGLGWVGVLIGFSMRVFNIDVKGILSSIYDGVKGLISGGNDKKVSSAQIDGIVNTAVQAHAGENNDESPSQIQTESIQQELKDAKMVRLALVAYDKQMMGLVKEADLSKFSASRRSRTTSVLGRVLSWIFKISLASAGFMVAGDAVNKLLDRPNAFDGSLKDGKPTGTAKEPLADRPTTTQTKFPVKSEYVDTQYNVGGTNWIEKINNSKSSIENMLVAFTKEVYDGLDGQDAAIRSTPGFKAIADNIAWYNHSAAGDPIIFIPKMFVSKKQLVDHFIDQVAKSNTSSSAPNVSPSKPAPGSYLV